MPKRTTTTEPPEVLDERPTESSAAPARVSENDWSSVLRRGLIEAELVFDCALYVLRMAELVVFSFVLVALAASLGAWMRSAPAFPEILEQLADHWQGAIIVGVVLLLPTLRDLAGRVQTAPGGWALRGRGEASEKPKIKTGGGPEEGP